MVAIVNGQGLGVYAYSTGLGGARGMLAEAGAGRNGQKVFLNATNGNLVVQTQDQRLFDHGLDLCVVRTYNSQGHLCDGSQGGLATGLYARRILPSGEFGASGSTLVRTTRDGAQSTLTWDNAYPALHRRYRGRRIHPTHWRRIGLDQRQRWHERTLRR